MKVGAGSVGQVCGRRLGGGKVYMGVAFTPAQEDATPPRGEV
jgi:hypothetical protein